MRTRRDVAADGARARRRAAPARARRERRTTVARRRRRIDQLFRAPPLRRRRRLSRTSTAAAGARALRARAAGSADAAPLARAHFAAACARGERAAPDADADFAADAAHVAPSGAKTSSEREIRGAAASGDCNVFARVVSRARATSPASALEARSLNDGDGGAGDGERVLHDRAAEDQPYKFNSAARGAFGEVWSRLDGHNISYAIEVLALSALDPAEEGGDVRRGPRRPDGRGGLPRCSRRCATTTRSSDFEIIDDGKGDRLFLVMDRCGGEVMADANLPAGESHCEHLARGAFRDLILGLEYLHVNGVLHRDIKPENIVYETRAALGQGATTPRGSCEQVLLGGLARSVEQLAATESSSKRRRSACPGAGGGSLAEKSLRDAPPIAEGASNTNERRVVGVGIEDRARGSARRQSDDERPTPCAKRRRHVGVAQMCELIEHPRTEGKYASTDDSVLKSAGTDRLLRAARCA